MRFIYECVSGDNGLLAEYKKEQHKVSFIHAIRKREENEIRKDKPGTDEVDVVNSEIYYNIYPSEAERTAVKSA